jgi:hypothetical protein
MLKNGNHYQHGFIVPLVISLEKGQYLHRKKKQYLLFSPLNSRPIPKKGSLKLTINTDACKNTKDEVNYLEHVQAFVTLKSSRRGNTVIFITSPLGTR